MLRSVADRLAGLLDAPITWWARVGGWAVATAAFAGGVLLGGGPSTGDTQLSVYATWAIAHGHLACAYPPGSVAGYTPAAPVWVLAAAAMAAALRLGASVPFPTAHALGAHCEHAGALIGAWSYHARALAPTVRLGYVAWAVLAAGVVALLAAAGRGRTRWEPLALVAVALCPGTVMCLTEFFHPQDLVAMGLALAATAAVLRDRWAAAGVLLALATCAQQFTLLVAVVLLVVVPARGRVRFVASAAVTVLVVALPLGALTSWRALPTVLAGSGESTAAGSLVVSLGLHGSAQFALARILPLALAALAAGVALDRLKERARTPGVLTALVALAVALRLPFDVAIWGYYLMATSVALVVCDVARRRLRLGLLVWLVLTWVAEADGAVIYAPRGVVVPSWCWQVALDAGALALAGSAVYGAMHEESSLAAGAAALDSALSR